MKQELLKKIEDRTIVAGGVGLGTVSLPLAGAKDIAPAVRSAVRSVYECMYSESELWRLVQIEKDENV